MAILSAFILPIENATEERSYDRVLVLSHAKKTKIQRTSANQTHFFPKNDKNDLLNGGLFQQVLFTWDENLWERSKEIELEDRIQKTDGENEDTVLDFLAQYEVYGYLQKSWRSSGKFTILLIFLRKRRRWAFLHF